MHQRSAKGGRHAKSHGTKSGKRRCRSNIGDGCHECDDDDDDGFEKRATGACAACSLSLSHTYIQEELRQAKENWTQTLERTDSKLRMLEGKRKIDYVRPARLHPLGEYCRCCYFGFWKK